MTVPAHATQYRALNHERNKDKIKKRTFLFHQYYCILINKVDKVLVRAGNSRTIISICITIEILILLK